MTAKESSSNKVVVKLFAGIPVKPELKLQLQQSGSWNQARVLSGDERDVIELHYQGRDYIGNFLSQAKPTLADVQSSDAHIRQCIARYCPNYSMNEISVHIFPQVFVT